MSIRPTFFPTPAAFRRWLQEHHRSAQELWVGFYKKSTGRPSITWPEALDEALCFGWIDGVRRSIDADSYMQRFTPRRQDSVWSAVNTRRMKELIRAGRVRAAGRKAFAARREESGYNWQAQRDSARLDAPLEARFTANRAAWTFFQAQPPGYRKMAIWFVMSAKQEATRLRRLDILIANSAAGLRLVPMRPATAPVKKVGSKKLEVGSK